MKITYQTLFDRLSSLGFEQNLTEWNGHTKRYFQLGDDEVSGLFLPDKLTKKAASMHVLLVRSLRKRFGLIDEDACLKV